MSFADAIAQADAFWSTLAVLDAALIVAVVVEGRSVREELERKASESANRRDMDDLRKEQENLRRELRELRARQDAPGFVGKPPDVREAEKVVKRTIERRLRELRELLGPIYKTEPAQRLALAFIALGALGFSIVIAMAFLVPLSDPGTAVTVIGFVLGVLAAIVGLVLLGTVGARRIAGTKLSRLLKGLFSRRESDGAQT